MEEKLRNSYQKIGINEKRMELSTEIKKISSMITEHLEQYDQKQLDSSSSYDPVKDKEKTEDEMLTIFYMDILKIEDQLQTLFLLQEVD